MMNSSRKAKTVDSSGLCRSRGSAPIRLLLSCARIGAIKGSSRLWARNTPDLLQLGEGPAALWLHKRQQRWLTSAQSKRLAPCRGHLHALPVATTSTWQALAARLCTKLGIDISGQLNRGMHVIGEPPSLVCAGLDAFARPLWLRADAWRAWAAMQSVAASDGIMLCPISGWRSMHYQARLLAAKLARGQSLATILEVSAAPGFSEHHAGTALDLACASDLVLEERFENSVEFAWLQQHARRFGFVLSLPRGNPYGYAYEPWHWRYGEA
jgi:D-alanyl-D-alanine carboxypeptidase